ncbi:MAG: type I DNA topoisomerase [Singulisphaera sp.]
MPKRAVSAPTSKAKPKSKATAKAKAKATEARPASGDDGPRGRSLVIVESPKKAKSINKFLGSAFVVKASMGHVRDLPKRKLSIDVENGYTPDYEIMAAKKETVSELKREAAKADMVYLATDPDREGEAIAWHLQKALGLNDDRVRRVAFHEITERAVKEAFLHVGPIDMDKVNAQQARRFLDRFVGYQLSPLLWSKVARHLSAGRVQSVAVRIIAEREKEIRAFVSEEYWRITATLGPPGSEAESDRFAAELAEWRSSKFAARTEAEAHAIRDALASAPYAVKSVEEVEKLDKADAPFKTSTLQQQAVIRLRFSSKRTMKVAQELYEGIDVGGEGQVGLITYMRTDSLRVSEEAMTEVRDLIGASYGGRYLPAKPNRYAAGKQAQEAHEAIRPTDLKLTPESIRSRLTIDQFKLYQLIYRRFVASQMTPAVFAVTNVAISAAEGVFKTQGKILKFDGHRRVRPAGKQEDQLLPSLAAGQELDLKALEPTQHFTQPPPRYSEAALIKALEKENIGRPSTYAPIIQTIQDRLYVEQKERRFFATDLGMIVTDLLVEHFPKIMDLKFTAHMEDELDDIATAKEDMVKVLDEFYHPFQEALKLAGERMVRVQVPSSETCHECGAPMTVKFSRTGSFLGCSRYPECKSTRPMDGQARPAAIETEHRCPKCGKPLMLRESKRGPFLSCSDPKCKELNMDAQGTHPRSSRPIMSVRSAASRWPCAGPGASGLHRLSQVPQHDAGRRSGAAVLGDGRGQVREVRRPDGRQAGAEPSRCLNYPKCRSTAPIPDDLKEKLGDLPGPAEAYLDAST